MVAQLAPASHPILSALTTSQEALEAVRDVQPVYMSPTEKKTAITELARLEAALVELRLRVVATADDAADLALSRDTGSWLASVTPRRFRRRAGRRPARRSTGPPVGPGWRPRWPTDRSRSLRRGRWSKPSTPYPTTWTLRRWSGPKRRW